MPGFRIAVLHGNVRPGHLVRADRQVAVALAADRRFEHRRQHEAIADDRDFRFHVVTCLISARAAHAGGIRARMSA